MKKLTIEQKAQRYDEAIKKAESLYKAAEPMSGCNVQLETIFPELKSEDERIRKELIEFFTFEHWDGEAPFSAESARERIAWLEKQGQVKESLISQHENKMCNENDDSLTNKDERIRRAIINVFATHKDYEMFFGASVEDIRAWLEKQGEKQSDSRYKYLKELITADDIYQMAMNNAMVREAKTKAIDALSKLEIGNLLEIEKQGEQESFTRYKVGDTIYYDSFGRLVSFVIANIVEDGTDNPMYEDKDGNSVFQNDIVKLKPADKVEPKFHEGDWVVRGNITAQILDVQEQYYVGIDTNGNDFTSSRFLSDDKIHLWTIQDAKDGDVIYSRHNTESFEWIGIFKSLDKENKRVFFYGFWHNMSKTFCVCGNEAYVLYDDFSPATKEQRDTLEKAMKEAGYEWDADKKELKKVEQKLTWSEEDEKMLNDILMCGEHHCYLDAGNIAWLKSLKDRVQPKKDLSEEDEKIINDIKESLLAYKIIVMDNDIELANYIEKEINWLKSIRPQSQWKPSDEQMKALKEACDENWEPDGLDPLYTLYEDLKKLRNE